MLFFSCRGRASEIGAAQGGPRGAVAWSDVKVGGGGWKGVGWRGVSNLSLQGVAAAVMAAMALSADKVSKHA